MYKMSKNIERELFTGVFVFCKSIRYNASAYRDHSTINKFNGTHYCRMSKGVSSDYLLKFIYILTPMARS